MKEPGGPLSDLGVSPHLQCEAAGIHKYAIYQILTGSLSYYMILNPESECPWIFLFLRVRLCGFIICIAVVHKSSEITGTYVVKVLVLMFPDAHSADS